MSIHLLFLKENKEIFIKTFVILLMICISYYTANTEFLRKIRNITYYLYGFIFIVICLYPFLKNVYKFYFNISLKHLEEVVIEGLTNETIAYYMYETKLKRTLREYDYYVITECLISKEKG